MNYLITFYYLNKKLFIEEIYPLIIETLENADYLTQSFGHLFETPDIITVTSLKIVGSQKKEIKKIIVDMDNIIENSLEPVIKPDKIIDNNLHYWQLAGSIIKSFPDTSTAYFTGFLTEKNKKDILNIFANSRPITNF
ncbi:hypothetical protein OWM07_04955 [Deferribacter thermophilus]|uniref:hypothetical protein n=1 Tax=Deferribacter thermophilus TaxID=53573 RepID=UPI003C1A47B7